MRCEHVFDTHSGHPSEPRLIVEECADQSAVVDLRDDAVIDSAEGKPTGDVDKRRVKGEPGPAAKGADPSDVEGLRNFRIAHAGLDAAEPGPVAFKAVDEIALLPIVAKQRSDCATSSRQFCRVATNVSGAVRSEVCPMAGDTPKNADIAARPAQRQCWRWRVSGGFYRQRQVSCMRCSRQREYEHCHQMEFLHDVSRPLFESSGRLAIFTECVASSDWMKAISFVTKPQSCSRLGIIFFIRHVIEGCARFSRSVSGVRAGFRIDHVGSRSQVT